jgi:hypothetical protein
MRATLGECHGMVKFDIFSRFHGQGADRAVGVQLLGEYSCIVEDFPGTAVALCASTGGGFERNKTTPVVGLPRGSPLAVDTMPQSAIRCELAFVIFVCLVAR